MRGVSVQRSVGEIPAPVPSAQVGYKPAVGTGSGAAPPSETVPSAAPQPAAPADRVGHPRRPRAGRSATPLGYGATGRGKGP